MMKSIFLIEIKFSWGYDLKFAIDAHIVIFYNEAKLSISEAEQMIGQSLRSQNNPHGTAVLVSS